MILHTRASGDGRELQRAEHGIAVGDGHGGHGLRRTEADQFLDRHRAFQQRIFGMGAEMDESDGIGTWGKKPFLGLA